jgi:hypothetical protein
MPIADDIVIEDPYVANGVTDYVVDLDESFAEFLENTC